MRAVLTLSNSFRLDGRLYHPGVYRVPQDVSEEFAQALVKEGATMERIGVMRSITTLTVPIRRRRKAPAPENKAVEAEEMK